MNAVQFTKPGEIRFADLPEPPAPGPGEALVRTHRMGICGTDVSGYLGKMPFFSYPRIPGHELGLEVIAIGPGVTHLQVGDRCSLEPYIDDPGSRASRKGASNCCPGVQVLGVHRDGGLRDYWICPARKLHPGNNLSYDQLALVETLAIGLHAVQRGNPQPGETVLVIGAGPIGLACLEFLRLLKVAVVVMDQREDRLRSVEGMGGGVSTVLYREGGEPLAEIERMTDGNFADVVIDATGSAQSMSECFAYAAHTGRVVYVGITAGEVRFPHAPIFHRRELTLLASRNALPADFSRIITLMGEGAIDTSRWITHRIAFADVPDAFANIAHSANGVIKAIIDVADSAPPPSPS